MPEIASRAEKAERVEPGNDDLAFGAHRAVDLAQQLVRVARELERVRENDQVERVLGEREPKRVGENLRGPLRCDGPSRGDPALRKERVRRESDLNGLKTEDVGDGPIEPRLFALMEVATQRCRQPIGERR